MLSVYFMKTWLLKKNKIYVFNVEDTNILRYLKFTSALNTLGEYV